MSNIKQFSKEYFAILNSNEFVGLNLTAIRDEESFFDKQIFDSIAPFTQVTELSEKLSKEHKRIFIDIGFGGGFPLLPLAWQFPERKFLGIESKGKKVDAVRKIAEKLSLKNVDFLHSRVEDVLFDSDCFVTYKAVGKVQDYLKRMTVTSSDVQVFFYKGKNFFNMLDEETGSIGANWKQLGAWEVKVPGADGRYIIAYGSTVPRRTPVKKLTKISNYI